MLAVSLSHSSLFGVHFFILKYHRHCFAMTGGPNRRQAVGDSAEIAKFRSGAQGTLRRHVALFTFAARARSKQTSSTPSETDKMLLTSLGQRIVIRGARKAIWMPTAPSKLFRIPEHTFYDNEETEQMTTLRIVYQAQMESIRKFMEGEFYLPSLKSGGIPPDFIEKESMEDADILAENDAINAKIGEAKEQFFEKRLKELEEQAMEEKLSKEEELIMSSQKTDEYVRKLLEDPNNFVTTENIDMMLDKALESPTFYEFYIDKKGAKHGLPQTSKPTESHQTSRGGNNETT